MYHKVIPVALVSDDFPLEFDDELEYESLGSRIRTAADCGVDLAVSSPLIYDDDEDGDMVDPMADPRADFFDQAEGLDAIRAQELAERQRREQIEAEAKLAAGQGVPIESSETATE
uniref:Uncharacterized protein n=1 Tax=Dulem virus 200 TaxID=3145677 RepID=A0AAU8B7F0_9VIRU